MGDINSTLYSRITSRHTPIVGQSTYDKGEGRGEGRVGERGGEGREEGREGKGSRRGEKGSREGREM